MAKSAKLQGNRKFQHCALFNYIKMSWHPPWQEFTWMLLRGGGARSPVNPGVLCTQGTRSCVCCPVYWRTNLLYYGLVTRTFSGGNFWRCENQPWFLKRSWAEGVPGGDCSCRIHAQDPKRRQHWKLQRNTNTNPNHIFIHGPTHLLIQRTVTTHQIQFCHWRGRNERDRKGPYPHGIRSQEA